MQAGEFSLHHGHIFHASKANCSKDRRIGFAIRYITPDMRQVAGEKPFAHLVAGEDTIGNFLPAPPPIGVMQQDDLENALRTTAIREQFFYEGAEKPGRRVT